MFLEILYKWGAIFLGIGMKILLKIVAPYNTINIPFETSLTAHSLIQSPIAPLGCLSLALTTSRSSISTFFEPVFIKNFITVASFQSSLLVCEESQA